MKKVLALAVALTICGLVFTGCQKKAEGPATGAKAPAMEQKMPPPPPPPAPPPPAPVGQPEQGK